MKSNTKPRTVRVRTCGAIRTVNKLEREIRRLRSAIRWALGYDGYKEPFRERRDGEGAYWWRKELRRRSGFKEARNG